VANATPRPLYFREEDPIPIVQEAGGGGQGGFGTVAENLALTGIRSSDCPARSKSPWNIYIKCGPGSSVGVATNYGLDGPGSNPGGDEIFRQSRPALGPTQPPVKWVPRLSRG